MRACGTLRLFEINSVSPLRGRDCSARGERRKRGRGGRNRARGGKIKGEKWRGAETQALTHPAVACLHSSSGTCASLDCLKERPAFPHHLNGPVPLPFHSLEGFSSQKTHLPYPRFFPPRSCLRLLIISNSR